MNTADYSTPSRRRQLIKEWFNRIGEAYEEAGRRWEDWLKKENPGSKNKERIMENLKASEVELSDAEFSRLEEALSACEVHGHRGYDESEQNRFLVRR